MHLHSMNISAPSALTKKKNAHVYTITIAWDKHMHTHHPPVVYRFLSFYLSRRRELSHCLLFCWKPTKILTWRKRIKKTLDFFFLFGLAKCARFFDAQTHAHLKTQPAATIVLQFLSIFLRHSHTHANTHKHFYKTNTGESTFNNRADVYKYFFSFSLLFLRYVWLNQWYVFIWFLTEVVTSSFFSSSFSQYVFILRLYVCFVCECV